MRTWKLQCSWFLVFAASDVALNLFNFWALRAGHDPGFAMPIFYTMFHMLVCSLSCLLLLRTCAPPPDGRLPSSKQFWKFKSQLIPISICTALSVGLNNESLGMVSRTRTRYFTVRFRFVRERVRAHISSLRGLISVGHCHLFRPDCELIDAISFPPYEVRGTYRASEFRAFNRRNC